MEQIRLGIIGIGNMGSEHCRMILAGKTPELCVAAVADPREDRQAWARRTLPEGTPIYADGMTLIEDGKCDAVLIATPHYLHPELSEAALRHGLHVLCEKPVGVYTAQIAPVLAAAKASGKTFALMFNQRTNCVYRRLKALLDSGELGQMKRVTWTITDWYRSQAYYDSGTWRATWDGEGGGVLLNQCPHQLDLLQWLCGMPTKVHAFCHEGKWHDIEVEDDVTAYLEFPSGATGVFIASTGELPGTNRLEIACDGGKIICENNQLLLWRLPMPETSFRQSQQAYPHPEITPELLETDGDNPQHMGVLNAFAAHLLHGTPLIAEGAEGLNSLALSNAMHLSAWTGETVAFPMDEDRFAALLTERRRTSRHKTTVNVTLETDHSATGAAKPEA